MIPALLVAFILSVALGMSSYVALRHHHDIGELQERVDALESVLADLAGTVTVLEQRGGGDGS